MTLRSKTAIRSAVGNAPIGNPPARRWRWRLELRPHRPNQGNLLGKGSLAGFVWRATGWHQIWLAVLAVAIAVLHFAPIDLQRRIADGAILQNDAQLLLVLGLIYGAIVLLGIAVKYVLLVYQSWLGESTIKVAREEIVGVLDRRTSRPAVGGQVVSVIGSETAQLGNFVGESISQALANATLLLVTVGYMALLEPVIAICSLALLAPQAALAPYLQAKLNRLIEQQLRLVRQLGNQMTARRTETLSQSQLGTVAGIYRNSIRFAFLKFALKALLNLANAMGPLTVLLIGGWMVIEGQTTLGTVVAFVSGFERLSGPLRELTSFYRIAAQAKVQHAMVTDWVAHWQSSAADGGEARNGPLEAAIADWVQRYRTSAAINERQWP